MVVVAWCGMRWGGIVMMVWYDDGDTMVILIVL